MDRYDIIKKYKAVPEEEEGSCLGCVLSATPKCIGTLERSYDYCIDQRIIFKEKDVMDPIELMVDYCRDFAKKYCIYEPTVCEILKLDNKVQQIKYIRQSAGISSEEQVAAEMLRAKGWDCKEPERTVIGLKETKDYVEYVLALRAMDRTYRLEFASQ